MAADLTLVLNVLKGMLFGVSVVSSVILVVGLLEEKASRLDDRHPSYRLSIGIFRVGSWFALWGLGLTLTNYVIRFFLGLPGSILPGPASGTVLSLASGIFALTFYGCVGVVLAVLVRVAHFPDDQEQDRRERMTEQRVEYERRARERRRHGSG